MKTLSHLVAPALLLLAATAQGQTVYRCGNSYSQQPCPGGTTVEASDARTPEQRRAQQADAQQQRRVADRLEKERLKEEAAAARAAEQADKAQRAADKAAQKSSTAQKSPHAKDKIPAYRAPAAPKQK